MSLAFLSCGKDDASRTREVRSVTPDRPEEQEAKVEPGATLVLEDDGRPVLVAFGDSLTAGFGVESRYSYPAYLQKLLNENNLSFRVVNAGISGDTTAGGLTRLPNVVAMKPAVVVLELGGNDGLRGLTLNQTKENLEAMIQGLEAAGAVVVLAGITLPRNYGQDYIEGFERIYEDLAAKYKLAFLPFLLEGVALNAETEDLMQDDGIHATEAGNEIVAKNVYQVVEPVLKTRR
jgi:acyl-CoA thioesterase I